MKHHKYLIVGGGMAADSAIHGIRQIDQDGAIAMICEERHPPYDQPAFQGLMERHTVRIHLAQRARPECRPASG